MAFPSNKTAQKYCNLLVLCCWKLIFSVSADECSVHSSPFPISPLSSELQTSTFLLDWKLGKRYYNLLEMKYRLVQERKEPSKT